MKLLLVGLLSVCIMSGCVSAGTEYRDGMRIRTAGETNLLRPSLSVMDVAICVEEPDRVETNMVNGETEVCQGTYQSLATVQGTQSGALTGLGGAMVQGGAIVGGAYLLGDGIRDSASQVNQTGGGASSQSQAKAKGGNARASSQSSSKQFQGQGQYQSQQQSQSMPMMRRGD